MERDSLRVIHVYEHDAARFERMVNEALARVVAAGGSVDEILYAIDPSSQDNRKGGFGALVLCEVPVGAVLEPAPLED